MKNFPTGWYLIYTKPRYEKKVLLQLTRMNIEAYLPFTRTLKTWHDRKKYVEEPLFPSYVFIHLKNLESYYGGIDADGALFYVKTKKEISRVSDSIVNDLKLVTTQANSVEVTQEYFQPGQKVVIREGALTGLNCEMVEVNEKKKLLVRVSLLQRNILISLPAEQLMPA
ncbi:transcription termination/antitermination protein NusG [Chitinophaga sp. RAB17]|uniref:transcription termination/antitermination protein NusG n=1 Tax=Chitinophaga sp. RAB17 TaxID=3233049 RepID=UPI003F906B8A